MHCEIKRLGAALLCGLFFLDASVAARAQAASPDETKDGLEWRLIGPFRAGRVVAVSGVPGSSTEFYFGSVGGGVWKTESAGTVWTPVFDGQPVASIGALAVAPSDSKVIYAGTGETDIRSDLASGNGVYRSRDGGRSWTHVGLEDTKQISRILVNRDNPLTVIVGALGHAYGPNAERGVYKSTDGGEHWKRVLDRGPEIGIADVAMAADGKVLFAATWNAHRPPWITYAPISGPGNGLFRSTDGGESWSEVRGHGLPDEDWGRVGVAVSSDGRRVYAALAGKDHAGLYRSDDGGESWKLVNKDDRLTSRSWYFNCLTIDPQNPDVLYIPNVALYRTEDGGKSFQIVRGAPGGDDYHQVWVDPKNSAHLMLGVDQGATVSLDRGKTWTSWYNQPTAQLYHVTTDQSFPYFVYGAQQDSGAIAVASRTDHGTITGRDWFQPTGSESGYIAIDPRDQNIIYVSGTYGSLQRFDRRTSLSQTITPWPLGGFALEISKRRYRDPWTPVLAFSQADKTSLYLGTQYVMKTLDGGLHWQEISPDLTGAAAKKTAEKGPVAVTNAKERGYGVVYTIAPSPLKAEQIWAGSDTGLIHLTRDGGKTWDDVTPKGLTPWSKIALIEASHFDPSTAFAVVDRHRLDDTKPYLYVTNDYGKSWSLRVKGVAPGAFLNAVREDPKQRGMLYAATEFGMYWSADEGAEWNSLQRNLPVTSVRDIDVHGDDLVIATHGRSFWILDDISPLRQRAEAERARGAYLYTPVTAMRVDNDSFLGTPLPPEEPQAKNPPQGAVIDYVLRSSAGKVSLRIYDAKHTLLRQFSSGDTPKGWPDTLPIAERWFPVPQMLAKTAGEHRFVWDLAADGSALDTGDDDEDDAGAPPGPRVPPGMYTAELVVDGRSSQRSFEVAMDPRDHANDADLQKQFESGQAIFSDALKSRKAMAEIQSVRSELKKLQDAGQKDAVARAQTKLAAILDGGGEGASEQTMGLSAANSGLGAVLRVVESGHRAAPVSSGAAYELLRKATAQRVAEWAQFKATDLRQMNNQLQRSGKQPVQIGAIEEAVNFVMTR